MDHESETGRPRDEGGPGRRRDPLEELQARIEAALEEIRPKVKRAFEELDSRVDAAVDDLRPKVEDKMREARPRMEQFVADIQPRMDELLRRMQVKLEDLRQDLESRARRGASTREPSSAGAGDTTATEEPGGTTV